MVSWQALKEQYPHEKISYANFKFKEAETTELYIKVVPPSQHDHCIIAMDPSTAKVWTELSLASCVYRPISPPST